MHRRARLAGVQLSPVHLGEVPDQLRLGASPPGDDLVEARQKCIIGQRLEAERGLHRPSITWRFFRPRQSRQEPRTRSSSTIFGHARLRVASEGSDTLAMDHGPVGPSRVDRHLGAVQRNRRAGGEIDARDLAAGASRCGENRCGENRRPVSVEAAGTQRAGESRSVDEAGESRRRRESKGPRVEGESSPGTPSPARPESGKTESGKTALPAPGMRAFNARRRPVHRRCIKDGACTAEMRGGPGPLATAPAAAATAP